MFGQLAVSKLLTQKYILCPFVQKFFSLAAKIILSCKKKNIVWYTKKFGVKNCWVKRKCLVKEILSFNLISGENFFMK